MAQLRILIPHGYGYGKLAEGIYSHTYLISPVARILIKQKLTAVQPGRCVLNERAMRRDRASRSSVAIAAARLKNWQLSLLSRMDKETYAHWLDASWGDFRKQLLEAYPDVSRSKSNSVPRSPERISKMSNMSSQSDEETGCAAFQMAVQRSETDLTADLPMDMSTEQMPEERPDDRPQLVQIKTDDDGGDATSEGSRQTELAVEGQSCLRSGLEGLSYQEAHAIRNRLRLRLNAIHSNAMVSGKELHTAVASLGLTKHSVEEMNEFLNLLADFIGLKFVEEERQLEEDEEDDVTSSYTSIALLFSDHRGSKRASTKIRRPVWAWPTQKDVTEHSNALKEVKVTLRRSVTATTGMDTEIKCNHNMAPAQALMEVFLAKEGPTHKHIFGSKRMDQFRAMKEILLAGDTNRLVAELTFVRINDLASPPEAVHPLVYIEPLVALLIIGNGVMIGFQTEPAHQEWPGWIYFEMSFAFVLWIEIGFRMRLLRCFQYWCGPERYWNWFDILLAGTGFSDIVLQLASGQEAEIGGTGLLRFCRLIRLVRIVKVFRIKILKDLRLMIRGLIAGIKTLSLAFLLLFAVLYVIAGFATISFGTDEKTIAIGLASYFKNIPATMFTAFRCFNGECVTDSGQPIPSLLAEEFGLPFILSYVASYMLVTMGIFNVILAVYVDITMRAAKENDIQTAEAYARESIRIARTTRELLKRFVAAYHAFCDMEENGTPNHHGSLKKLPSAALLTEDLMTDVAISKELFLLVIQDKKIQRLMDELDLPPDRANLPRDVSNELVVLRRNGWNPVEVVRKAEEDADRKILEQFYAADESLRALVVQTIRPRMSVRLGTPRYWWEWRELFVGLAFWCAIATSVVHCVRRARRRRRLHLLPIVLKDIFITLAAFLLTAQPFLWLWSFLLAPLWRLCARLPGLSQVHPGPAHWEEFLALAVLLWLALRIAYINWYHNAQRLRTQQHLDDLLYALLEPPRTPARPSVDLDFETEAVPSSLFGGRGDQAAEAEERLQRLRKFVEASEAASRTAYLNRSMARPGHPRIDPGAFWRILLMLALPLTCAEQAGFHWKFGMGRGEVGLKGFHCGC
eukprot:s324_g5.t1